MKIIVLFLVLVLHQAALSQPKRNTAMTNILKNKNLEVQIDIPSANYNFSRFDWTGKIVSVKYKGISVSSVEKFIGQDDTNSGKGFYNEFGISAAIGFDEIKEGEWFHKIGVGLLKKEGDEYLFHKNYDIRPAAFKVTVNSDRIKVHCIAMNANGYAYEYKKEIELLESGFIIKYQLKNTGTKTIVTNEYNHNFIAIDNDLVSGDYILKFPFGLNPELFEATVNPEGKVEIGLKELTFNGTPDQEFFFSHLNGNKNVDANWELINTKSKIGISETGSFKTNKVNLWGWKHVISPEVFFDIFVEPGKKTEWSRVYRLFETE